MSGVSDITSNDTRHLVARILIDGGWAEGDAHRVVEEGERRAVLAAVAGLRDEGLVDVQREGIPTPSSTPLNRAEWEAEHGDLEKAALMVRDLDARSQRPRAARTRQGARDDDGIDKIRIDMVIACYAEVKREPAAKWTHKWFLVAKAKRRAVKALEALDVQAVQDAKKGERVVLVACSLNRLTTVFREKGPGL